jgi:hypothetical protein
MRARSRLSRPNAAMRRLERICLSLETRRLDVEPVSDDYLFDNGPLEINAASACRP